MKTPRTPPHPAGISRREFIRSAALTATALSLPRAAWSADAPAEPVKKLGIALAGLGAYATILANAMPQTKLCEVRGVITRSPETKGRQWAQALKFPEKNIYSPDTMDQIANNPDIDIVYVTTPNGLHAEYAIPAALAGKHVISEKPMANTVAECDAMIRACAARKRTLAVGYRLHFDPYHLEVARRATDPNFGPFTKMSGENGFTLNGDQWRIHKKLSGGGPLMDMGIYVVNETCLATGANPIAVTAKEHPKTRPNFFRDVEEGLDWTLEFPGGVLATCQTSYVQNYSHFHAEGAKGWVDLPSAFGYNGLQMNTSTGPVNYPPMIQQVAQLDSMARCILDGKDTPVPGELGRRDLVIIEGIYKSAALEGKRIELDYS